MHVRSLFQQKNKIMKSRIEQLQEFLKEDSNDSFLRYTLALEYVGVEKNDTARDLFLKLIKDDENYIATYYQLGKLYESLSALGKAREIYKKGIKIAQKSENKKTLLELQEAYNMLIDIDEEGF
jgi:tetratricopeptide (TPR) repeat protein|tara:strand:- start:1002 stop:1373 length:372 start_codon:yes stop_codon:yes gene_type:complete